MMVYLYNEKGEPAKEFDLACGVSYNFGINEQEKTFGILDENDKGRILFKLAVDDDTNAEILDAGCNEGLFINNKPVTRTKIKRNDEILADNHLLRIGKPVSLTNYFFIEPEKDEEPILISDQMDENIVISSILPVEEQTIPISDQLDTDSYSRDKMYRQLGSLLDVSRDLNATYNLEGLVNKIIDYLFQVLIIDRVAVIVSIQKEGRRKILVSRAGCRRGIKSTNVVVSKTILNAVLRDRVAVASANAMEDPRFSSQDSVQEHQIRSAICIPLIHKKVLLGALYADSSNPAVRFTLQDLQFLSILANLTSIAIQNALRFTEMEMEIQGWKNGIQIDKLIIGNSLRSQELYGLIKRVANSRVSVILTGETGTGKELCGRAIHQLSSRRTKPFIAVNCATIPENLLESEMFGYEKGAFTGAMSSKPGKFELAEGGTIFLDEISEISPQFQAKLLRVIEGLGFERVGGIKTLTPDIRIIAATNKNLEQEVKEGRFRADLFWRLNVFPIWIPPLRERKEDILLIARYYLKKFARENSRLIEGFTTETEKWMLEYEWPGNIRQLKNMIECSVILCDRPRVGLQHFGIHSGMPKIDTIADKEAESESSITPLWEQEKESIIQALQETGWNKSQAARLLGISRHHLIYRMTKYHIKEIPEEHADG